MKNSIDHFTRQTEKASKQTSMFQDALSTASGMLARDFVRGATQAVTSGMELAAEFQSLNSSFNAMKTNLGATDLSLEKLQKAVKGTVAKTDLLAAANKSMSLGVPTEKMDELFASAMRLGRVMGIDTLSAVDSLATGIGRQSKMILDNLGVVFDAETAYVWYSNKIGVNTSELTDNQKKLAWQEYAMLQVTKRAEDLGDVEDDMVTKQEQMSASMKDFNTDLGNALGPLGQFQGVFDAVAPVLSAVAIQTLPTLIGKLKEMKAGFDAANAAAGLTGLQGTLLKLKNIGSIIIPVAVVIGIVWAIQQAIDWIKEQFLYPEMQKTAEGKTPVSPKTWEELQKGLGLSGVKVPGGAEGGIIKQPTLLFAGEKGPEALIPLDRGVGSPIVQNFYFTVDEWTDLNKVKAAAKEGAAEGLAESYQSRGGF
jgi:hypothetical protein